MIGVSGMSRRRIRRVCGSAVALVLTWALCPQRTQGQQSESIRIGVGLATTSFPGARGAHGMVGGVLPVTPSVGLRADALVAVGDFRIAGTEVMLGAGGGVVFRRSRGGVRPYGGLGLGYTRASWGDNMPLAHDFGVNFWAGVEADFWKRRWFLEVSPRFFGNIFHDRAITRSVTLFSIGWRY